MPSLGMLDLPAPSDEYEFELMTKDYCDFKFGESKLFGRRGQEQYGVDIISHSSSGLIGIQCKNYNKTTITCKRVDEMIETAEKLQLEMKTFVIATTAQRNSHIQLYVERINDERIKQSKFGVSIIYWDIIIDYIKSDEKLFGKYYSFENIINKSKNSLIKTLEELKSKLAECISEFQVYDFMHLEPTNGMPGYMPGDIDCFVEESIKLLNRAFMCRTNKEYAKISEFVFEINQYSSYLGTILDATYSGNFTVQNRYIIEDIDEVRKVIKEYKKNIDSIFGEIFIGISFYDSFNDK